jgi:hypothetical protein
MKKAIKAHEEKNETLEALKIIIKAQDHKAAFVGLVTLAMLLTVPFS